jgi:hypothetical protein
MRYKYQYRYGTVKADRKPKDRRGTENGSKRTGKPKREARIYWYCTMVLFDGRYGERARGAWDRRETLANNVEWE